MKDETVLELLKEMDEYVLSTRLAEEQIAAINGEGSEWVEGFRHATAFWHDKLAVASYA